jgi:hypothetical protein
MKFYLKSKISVCLYLRIYKKIGPKKVKKGKDCNLILQLKNILQSNFTIKKQIAIYLLIVPENQTQIYLEFI